MLRPLQNHTDADSSGDELITSYLEQRSLEKTKKMNEEQIAQLEAKVQAALDKQASLLEEKIAFLTNQLSRTTVSAPQIEIFREIEIVPEIICNEPLDIIKSIPEFDGKMENYVSWRQAASAAYKVFEPYNGSSRHYQAVAIIRNKVRGSADAVLASFNTVLNFKAIIARLDFTYADKTPVHVIQQQLSTLQQGNLPLLQYFDEVEKKLNLLTNKTLMTHDSVAAAVLNEKFRSDALHVFISGLKKSLKWAVFPAQPIDLPSALALAQEAESSNERGIFAANFAKHLEEKPQKQKSQNWRQNAQQGTEDNSQNKNPHFQKNQKDKNDQQKPNSTKQRYNNQKPQGRGPEPMEVDSSSRFRQPTQGYKNNQGYGDQSMRTLQNLNHLPQDESNGDYESRSQHETAQVEDDLSGAESCNFLAGAPCFRS